MRLLKPDFREALLAFAAAGCDDRPLPAVEDWAALLAAAVGHGLVPLAYHLIKKSDCPCAVKRAFRIEAAGAAVRSAQQRAALGEILAAFRAASVPVIVLKGPALAESVYPHPSLRPFRDLDLLCREEDWVAAHKVLVRLGFTPMHRGCTPPPKVWRRKAFYHTQYAHPTRGVFVEVHYDLWQHGFRPRLGERFWDRAVPLCIASRPAMALSAEDQLLHSCIHLHSHGYDRLIWFSDLARLLRSQEIDWPYVVAAAKREGFGLSVYYSLRYLALLLGVGAPQSVFAALRPGPVQAWVHGRIWPAEAVLGLETGPRALFDFAEVPQPTELLINMLLTGRRWEKAVYLCRLLVPSSAWLAYYYGTDEPAALRRRRFIHAPKLLATTVGGLGPAALALLADGRTSASPPRATTPAGSSRIEGAAAWGGAQPRSTAADAATPR